MHFISTRGEAPSLTFPDVLLAGTASDGGLYVPESWPHATLQTEEYPAITTRMTSPYLGDALGFRDQERLAEDAYASFSTPDVVPLREVSDGLFVMELFWGPTLAFKDLPLQLLGRLFEEVLSRTGRTATVIGATSGDTGAAAIEAFRGRSNVTVVILHPSGRISEVQRRQMTTVPDDNVHNLAVEGTFDDCQALVKRLFSDEVLREEIGLASANSINWLRIAAQTAPYAAACLRLGKTEVDFSVPSGNFGNAYAGYVARAMGVPVGRVIVATNRNRGLADLIAIGEMRVERPIPTMSPAMDIQVPSNLERILFDIYDRTPDRVREALEMLAADRALALPRDVVESLRTVFAGEAVSEEETSREIAAHYRSTGRLIDPHTAVALAAARRHETGRPLVVFATAHPGKFPDAVERASGAVPALPERFAGLPHLAERFQPVSADYGRIRKLVRAAGNPDR
jgi:threonine synthase